ncbi:hypothetical protein D3C75_1065520 [compost metagenome]
MTTFDTSPKPNQRIISGAIARWGTSRSTWILGSSRYSALRNSPVSTPNSRPRIPPITNPVPALPMLTPK